MCGQIGQAANMDIEIIRPGADRRLVRANRRRAYFFLTRLAVQNNVGPAQRPCKDAMGRRQLLAGPERARSERKNHTSAGVRVHWH